MTGEPEPDMAPAVTAALLPLVLEDVVIRLGSRTLVTVDATIMPGEVLSVMGPSGSGKSTLLAFAGGFLDRAFSAGGRVLHGDRDLTRLAPQERHAGLLFQDPLLFPHMSVAGNLLFALPSDLRGRAARLALAEEALADVGLGGCGQRDPATLSGGQKARVALARVMLSRPRFLLLDEPFSKLDAALRAQIRTLVFERARRLGVPVLLVTHDMADAQAAGGQIITIGDAA